MTDHDHTVELLVAERTQLRARVAELEQSDDVRATNIAAIQDSAGKPSLDFDGCIE